MSIYWPKAIAVPWCYRHLRCWAYPWCYKCHDNKGLNGTYIHGLEALKNQNLNDLTCVVVAEYRYAFQNGEVERLPRISVLVFFVNFRQTGPLAWLAWTQFPGKFAPLFTFPFGKKESSTYCLTTTEKVNFLTSYSITTSRPATRQFFKCSWWGVWCFYLLLSLVLCHSITTIKRTGTSTQILDGIV